MIIYILFVLLLLSALGLLLVPVLNRSDLPFRRRNRFIAAVGLVFFIGTFGFYALLGSPELLPAVAEYHAKIEQAQKGVLEQSDAVKANPENLAAWLGLGQNYMQAGQYKSASNAFKQAVLLSKGNPLIILAYATAMISDADGKITDDAKKSLEMVLLQQPENPEARYLLSVRMLQDGNTKDAMKSMKELYQSLPEDSPLKAMIDKQIGRK